MQHIYMHRVLGILKSTDDSCPFSSKVASLPGIFTSRPCFDRGSTAPAAAQGGSFNNTTNKQHENQQHPLSSAVTMGQNSCSSWVRPRSSNNSL